MSQAFDPEFERLKRYERMWEFEMEAREQLTGRLQLALGLITLLATILGYWILRLAEIAKLGVVAGGLVASLLAAGLVFAALAAIQFKRGCTGHLYGVLPTAQDLESHRRELLEHHTRFANGTAATPAETAHVDLLRYLNRYYVDVQSTNARINEKRYLALHWATSHTYWGLILAAAATLVYGLATWIAS